MSLGWSILIIVIGGGLAIALYVGLTGSEHVDGARRLVDHMRDERARGGEQR